MLDPPLPPPLEALPLADGLPLSVGGPSVPLDEALAEPDEDIGDSVSLPEPLMDESGPSVPSVLSSVDIDSLLAELCDGCEPLPPVGCWLVAHTGM